MQLDKVTNYRQSEEKRRYDDACAAAHGMDLIGDRWAMPIVRELLLGPRRFSDLKKTLRVISANVLTQRLEQLDEAGIVVRRKLPPPASVQVYELTPWGYEAGPIFQAMGRWAVRSPRHDPNRPFSPVSLMLSLRTMFSSEAAGHFAARIQLKMDEESFFWIREGAEIRIGRGEIEEADLTITAPPTAIAGVVYGGAPFSSIQVDGDMELAKRFITLFPLPPKVEAS